MPPISSAVPDAGEVGHRADFQLVLDARNQIDCFLAGRAARAVSDRDIAGFERMQVVDGAVQGREAFFGFGREEFEGDGWQAAV